jgi:transposase-like protein
MHVADAPGCGDENTGGEEREKDVEYSEAMRARMIKRMTGPKPMSATTLSQETGIPQPTLSRWLRGAGTLRVVSKDEDSPVVADASTPRKRAQDWTWQEKLRAVLETASMSDDDLGAFLRRNGLHREQLEQWRQQATTALANEAPRRKRGGGPTPEQKRIRELERQLLRKDKALAEVAALLVLKKKAAALFGDEEDDTEPRSEE